MSDHKGTTYHRTVKGQPVTLIRPEIVGLDAVSKGTGNTPTVTINDDGDVSVVVGNIYRVGVYRTKAGTDAKGHPKAQTNMLVLRGRGDARHKVDIGDRLRELGIYVAPLSDGSRPCLLNLGDLFVSMPTMLPEENAAAIAWEAMQAKPEATTTPTGKAALVSEFD